MINHTMISLKCICTKTMSTKNIYQWYMMIYNRCTKTFFDQHVHKLKTTKVLEWKEC